RKAAARAVPARAGAAEGTMSEPGAPELSESPRALRESPGAPGSERAADDPGAAPTVVFDGEAPHLTTRTRKLPCGLDVVVHPDIASPQVMVSVWYRVGSSDERPDRTGFAHLFEHLFKSPPERLGGHHYEVLRRAGATEANASTSTDRTAYHEVLPAHQLE